MTEYLTLTEFTPGTKARPEEINANFGVLKNAILQKASVQGDVAKTFSVAPATENTHAINKSQLESLSQSLTDEIAKAGAKFCANSGNISAGKPDLFGYSGLMITPKIGGTYSDLTISDYSGAKTVINFVSAISMSGKTDGTYNIFITPAGVLYASKNKIYRQAARPAMTDGDVWLNTSVEPLSCIKYDGTSDGEFLDVPLGVVVILANAITSLTTNEYNMDGYSVNKTNDSVITEAYANGTSWYRVWSDGWIEQGGQVYNNTAGAVSNTINFLKPFTTTNYYASRTPGWLGTYDSSVSARDTINIYNNTLTSFSAYTYSVTGLNQFRWYACGY